MQSPVPWGPRGRKMVKYEMNDEDTEAMIAYLKWIGGIDLNGFDRVVSPLAKDKK